MKENQRNIYNNISKSFNKLIYFFLLLIYFSISTLGYEIIRLQKYFRDKFNDRAGISSFHFCQWQFLNSTAAIEDEILHLNIQNSWQNGGYDKGVTELLDLFKNNFAYGPVYDEFCKNIHYCGVYYVKFCI